MTRLDKLLSLPTRYHDYLQENYRKLLNVQNNQSTFFTNQKPYIPQIIIRHNQNCARKYFQARCPTCLTNYCLYIVQNVTKLEGSW